MMRLTNTQFQREYMRMKKSGDSDLEIYVTRSCLHCEEAACLKVCRYGALKRDERGFVIPVRENCKGV